jgi:hypothetical protein
MHFQVGQQRREDRLELDVDMEVTDDELRQQWMKGIAGSKMFFLDSLGLDKGGEFRSRV